MPAASNGMAEFFYDVLPCPRCGRPHTGMRFIHLARPINGWTHYSTCPNLYQPIVLQLTIRVEETDFDQEMIP